jgi:hypothetical protein
MPCPPPIRRASPGGIPSKERASSLVAAMVYISSPRMVLMSCMIMGDSEHSTSFPPRRSAMPLIPLILTSDVLPNSWIFEKSMTMESIFELFLNIWFASSVITPFAQLRDPSSRIASATRTLPMMQK